MVCQTPLSAPSHRPRRQTAVGRPQGGISGFITTTSLPAFKRPTGELPPAGKPPAGRPTCGPLFYAAYAAGDSPGPSAAPRCPSEKRPFPRPVQPMRRHAAGCARPKHLIVPMYRPARFSACILKKKSAFTTVSSITCRDAASPFLRLYYIIPILILQERFVQILHKKTSIYFQLPVLETQQS